MFATIAADFKNTLAAPFRGNMDLFTLFLSVGLVVIAVLLWTRILSHLSDV